MVVDFSMRVPFWPGELFVSYAPQAVIILAGIGMMYLTIAAWVFIKTGVANYILHIGRSTVYTVSIILSLGLILLLSSSRVVVATTFVDEFSANREQLTLGSFNKLYNSRNFMSDAQFLLEYQTDIVALQEVTRAEIDLLGDSMGYEYRYVSDCECSANRTELGIVSRHPIVFATTQHYLNNSVISRAEIRLNGQRAITVYNVHLSVPVSAKNYEERATVYDYLAAAIELEPHPTILMGDFNTTVFSPQMQEFMQRTPSLMGVFERRWPRCSWFAYGEIGCLRIDHIFVPSTAEIKSLNIATDASSDHHPIVVEMAL